MVNLTALIRCKREHTAVVLEALLAVGDYVRAKEPGTLDYRVIQCRDTPELLITQERFESTAAMEAHNNGEGSQAFFTSTQGLIASVEVHVGDERSSG